MSSPEVSAILMLKSCALQAGLIINIGSIAGEMAFAPMAVYATSKWALRGWSLSCYEVCCKFRPNALMVCLVHICTVVEYFEQAQGFKTMHQCNTS